MPPGRTLRRQFSNVVCVPERLDRDVDAAAREPLDLGDDVLLLEIEHDVCAHAASRTRGGAGTLSTPMTSEAPGEARARGSAKADGALREHGDGVAEAHVPRSAAENPVDMMSGQSSTSSSARDRPGSWRGWPGRSGTSDVLGLAAVDRVAEPPAADRLVADRRRGRTATCAPERQARHWPHGVMAPTMTRSPTA